MTVAFDCSPEAIVRALDHPVSSPTLSDIIDDEQRRSAERAQIAGRCAELGRLANEIVQRELAHEADPTGRKGKRWPSWRICMLNRRIAKAMRGPI